MTVGERIKLIRTNEGLSQTAFGEKIGVNRDAVKNIEMDKLKNGVPIPTIKAISSEFEIEESWIISGGDEQPQKKKKKSPKTMAELLIDYVDNGDGGAKLEIVRALERLTDEQLNIIRSTVKEFDRLNRKTNE